MKDHVEGLTASREAIEFTQRSFVFDCLSLLYVLEEKYAERCLAGGVNACNVTFGTEEVWEKTIRIFEESLEKIEKSPVLALGSNADALLHAQEEGKLAIVPGTQGGGMVGRELWRVELMHRLGLRYIGLAYTGANNFADGCGEKRNGGLTFLGQEFIDTVNGLPLILDLSHSGHSARAEAADRALRPVCTHSNAYNVNANDRNTKDETAKVIAAKGGMMGVCALSKPVKDTDPTIENIVDHCDHWVQTLSIDRVGIGLDFVEAYQESKQILPESKWWRLRRPDIFGTVDDFTNQSYPRGLESIRLLPNLTQALFDRGYVQHQVSGILGRNWLQHFHNTVG